MHIIVKQHEHELNFRKANDMKAKEAVDTMIVGFLGKVCTTLTASTVPTSAASTYTVYTLTRTL
jgi:hypothetical protein